MADLNKVFLMGRLTFDPELRRTATGTAVTELRMATTRRWSGRDGERREETLFIDVTVWDRQAENCCQFLRKGSSIHVEGSLRMDTWDDKTTGEKRSKIRVHAEPGGIQFLDSRRSDSGGGGSMGGGAGMDEEPAPPAARDAGMRRSGPAPARGTGGGYGEPRGPANGPPRMPYPPNGPAGHPSLNDEPDEDDIPF
jgi:single-strand DNA-binding protein